MGDLVLVTAIGALRERRPLIIEHDGVPYTILLKDGRIEAYINICPHQDKVFKPRLKDECLICPFHDVAFDVHSGKVVDSNGKTVRAGLPKAEVLVRDGWICLVTNERHRSLLEQAWARKKERGARKRKWSWTSLFGLGGKKNGDR